MPLQGTPEGDMFIFKAKLGDLRNSLADMVSSESPDTRKHLEENLDVIERSLREMLEICNIVSY